jgi:hypothetical protein
MCDEYSVGEIFAGTEVEAHKRRVEEKRLHLRILINL